MAHPGLTKEMFSKLRQAGVNTVDAASGKISDEELLKILTQEEIDQLHRAHQEKFGGKGPDRRAKFDKAARGTRMSPEISKKLREAKMTPFEVATGKKSKEEVLQVLTESEIQQLKAYHESKMGGKMSAKKIEEKIGDRRALKNARFAGRTPPRDINAIRKSQEQRAAMNTKKLFGDRKKKERMANMAKRGQMAKAKMAKSRGAKGSPKKGHRRAQAKKPTAQVLAQQAAKAKKPNMKRNMKPFNMKRNMMNDKKKAALKNKVHKPFKMGMKGAKTHFMKGGAKKNGHKKGH